MSEPPPEANLDTHFSEPTTHYWQEILPPSTSKNTPPPWKYGVPVQLPDSRILMLPVRPLKANPEEAVASLLVNQASMEVVDELGRMLGDRVNEEGFEVDMVIGLPTLGLSLAPIVAKSLGLKRYVPLGYSHKFWYTDDLSTDVSSITSPGLNQKKVYLDPHQLPLIKNKKCLIIDDAVSSGKTLKATWDMLEAIGCEIVACGVAMKQGARWMEVLGAERTERLVWVFESPLLRKVEGGWDVRV